MIPVRLPVAHIEQRALRSALMAFSVAVTIFLFCTLRSVVVTMNNSLEASRSVRLVTVSAVSLFVDLPLSMQPKIRNVPGVSAVTHMTWFGGTYIDLSNFFAKFATHVPTFRRVYGDDAPGGAKDMLMSTSEWEAFENTPTGCVVGKDLADLYGWKVGSRIPITGTIYEGDYEFEVMGVYTSNNSAFDQRTMWFHWDYVSEWLGGYDRIGMYSLLLDDADRVGFVSQKVDAHFENSSTRTLTMTERALNAQFISMYGNISVLLGGIVAAVLFACFLISVNTMLLHTRERFREIGILKALGFSNGSVALLSLLEALLLCGLGAALGIGLAALLYNTPATANLIAGLRSYFPSFGVPLVGDGGSARYRAVAGFVRRYPSGRHLGPTGCTKGNADGGLMKIPFHYHTRSLFRRRWATLLTVTAIGCSVAVLAVMLGLAHGFERSLGNTGQADNLIVLRQGAGTEGESYLGRDQAQIIASLPGVARSAEDLPLAGPETYAAVSLNRVGGGTTNVPFRGVSVLGPQIQATATLGEGRWFNPGTREVVVGQGLIERIEGCRLGGAIRFSGQEWPIVGIIVSPEHAWNSEIWTDVEGLMQVLDRTWFSTMVIRAAPGQVDNLVERVATDQRLQIEGGYPTHLLRGPKWRAWWCAHFCRLFSVSHHGDWLRLWRY